MNENIFRFLTVLFIYLFFFSFCDAFRVTRLLLYHHRRQSNFYAIRDPTNPIQKHNEKLLKNLRRKCEMWIINNCNPNTLFTSVRLFWQLLYINVVHYSINGQHRFMGTHPWISKETRTLAWIKRASPKRCFVPLLFLLRLPCFFHRLHYRIELMLREKPAGDRHFWFVRTMNNWALSWTDSLYSSRATKAVF